MIRWDGRDGRLRERHAILFDFDGTLADTKPTIIAIASRALVDFGLDEDLVAARIDGIFGPPFPDAFSLVFGLSAADAREVTRRYREVYFALGRDAWPFFPGVHDLLRELREAGRTLGVASSKLQRMIERGIADNGATELFDAIVGKVDGVTDTKAEAVVATLARLGASATEAVMVGDRSYDVEGARAAGLPCVGVLFAADADRGELAGAGAVATVDTVDELRAVLLGT